MAVLSYNQILTKKVIEHSDEPHVVLSHHIFRKQKRKPVNITKLKSLTSGRVVEHTFHQSDTAPEADLEKRPIVFIYRNDGKGEYWFHEVGKPGERFALTADLVGDAGRFLKEQSEVDALVYNDEVIGVTVPIKVELKVTEAMPAVKGNTSSGAQKEVTLESSATLMVPMFINEGDVISVNTETGAYSERIEKA